VQPVRGNCQHWRAKVRIARDQHTREVVPNRIERPDLAQLIRHDATALAGKIRRLDELLSLQAGTSDGQRSAHERRRRFFVGSAKMPSTIFSQEQLVGMK
jgi:hypothetical protein